MKGILNSVAFNTTRNTWFSILFSPALTNKALPTVLAGNSPHCSSFNAFSDHVSPEVLVARCSAACWHQR